MVEFAVDVDGEALSFHLDEGEIVAGDNSVLLQQDDNLAEGQPWDEVGYVVAPFLPVAQWRDVLRGFERFIAELVTEAIGAPPQDFRMADYHRWITSDELHRRVIEARRSDLPVNMCFPAAQLPGGAEPVTQRIAEICGKAVAPMNATLPATFSIRIVRPRSADHSPLHRDAWIGRLRHGINIYLPLAGSDERSSLCVMPGSHRWPESHVRRSSGPAVIDGRPYTVPAVVDTKYGMRAVRPNPGKNEVLVFSPYVIHGAGANLNPDATRISLEMRFWRQNNLDDVAR